MQRLAKGLCYMIISFFKYRVVITDWQNVAESRKRLGNGKHALSFMRPRRICILPTGTNIYNRMTVTYIVGSYKRPYM